MKRQEDAVILRNRKLQNDYFQLELQTATVAAAVQPGQFVHAQFQQFKHRVLRRPFSVCNTTTDGRLTIIYKVVGEGTEHLSRQPEEAVINLLGPLGQGYSIPAVEDDPIIVAGGYGCAATFMLAARSPVPPLCLLGGRSRDDLLLIDEFRQLGCEVRISTDDGSCGYKGFVTDLLVGALEERVAGHPAVYACGPNPMLHAVSRLVDAHDLDAEVSLDHAMCCGVGACFACVVRMKADTADGWDYVRTCLEGPVFKASRIYWE